MDEPSRPQTDLIWTLSSLPSALRLYPERHPRAVEILGRLERQLGSMVAAQGGPVRLTVTEEEGVVLEGDESGQQLACHARLGEALLERGIESIEFDSAEHEELTALARLLATPAEAVAAQRVENECFGTDTNVRVGWARQPGAAQRPDQSEDVWRDVATQVLRQQLASHDVTQTLFVLACDSYLRAETETQRGSREATVETIAYQAGAGLAAALEHVLTHLEAEEDVAGILQAALPHAYVDVVLRFAPALGGDVDNVRSFLRRCAARDDVAELFVALVRLDIGDTWRDCLVRSLKDLATARPDGSSRLASAAFLAPEPLRTVIELDPDIVQPLVQELVRGPATAGRTALLQALPEIGTDAAYQLLTDAVRLPDLAEVKELQDAIFRFRRPEATALLRAADEYARAALRDGARARREGTTS